MMKDLETSNGTIAAISQLHQTMAEMLSATENGVQPSAIKVNLEKHLIQPLKKPQTLNKSSMSS